MKKTQGFTLIELMIAMVVLGILALFALIAYQDYTKRAYVAEGLNLISAAKMVMTETYSSHGYLYYSSSGQSVNQAYGLADDIQGIAVEKILVGYLGTPNQIHIQYNKKVAQSAIDIYMYSEPLSGSIKWYCAGSQNASLRQQNIKKRWLPANCYEKADDLPNEVLYWVPNVQLVD